MHSFYIHWPFCPYKCHFCPFVAFSKHETFMGQYHEVLKKELLDFHENVGAKVHLETIYFGGGTPSTYPNELLLDTFDTLKKVSSFNEDAEITFEVNPGTVTKQKLMLYRQLGINRLSVGVQSLKESALTDLNRLQTTQDVHQVIADAQGVFENVSIDLILGLPNVSATEWKEQLKKIVTWPITHISIYFLMVHEFTPLYYRVKKEDVTLPVDDEVVDLYQWTVAYVAEHGFEQYEISSFARDGYRSKHNQAYWQRKAYKGFGVGAWSFEDEKRYRNVKNLFRYMQGVQKGETVVNFTDNLTEAQIALEQIMLGLRQTKGMPLRMIKERCTHKSDIQFTQQIDAYKKEGLLKEKDGTLQLTPAGLAVEQTIITQLSS